MEQQLETKNKPVKKIRVGVISATVWLNDGKDGKQFPTVNVERSYKDTKGAWKSTSSMRFVDLPVATAVFQQAFLYCSQLAENELLA